VLGASLVTVRGEIVTTVYDVSKNEVPRQDVKEGTTCDVVLELAGLWFLKKSFGPIWRAVQVRVRGAPKIQVAKGYLFMDEPAAEEDDPADYLD
jgi:hypothetical protein